MSMISPGHTCSRAMARSARRPIGAGKSDGARVYIKTQVKENDKQGNDRNVDVARKQDVGKDENDDEYEHRIRPAFAHVLERWRS